MKAMEIIKNENKWKERFSRRGTTFFLFVKYWARYVSEILVNNSATDAGDLATHPWQHIVGYRSIVKSVLLSMRTRTAEKFPDGLVNAMAAMVRNPRLASVAIKMTLRRTNAFDQNAVAASLEIVDYYFQVLTIRKCTLPSDFDFSFLNSAIKILITDDSARNILNTIWLYFRNFQVLAVSGGIELISKTFLNREIFFSLLSHWSPLVRHRFVLFLLYRVAPFSENPAISVLFEKCLLNVAASLEALESPPNFKSSKGSQIYLTEASRDWANLLPEWKIWKSLDATEMNLRIPQFALSDGAEFEADPDIVATATTEEHSDGED